MIYFGLRSSKAYLKLLDELRTFRESHQIISVIGGLAFLHALGAFCTRLTLTDVDPDAEKHARLVLRLIEISESCGDFLSLLSGRRIAARWWEGSPFGDRVDHRPRLNQAFADESLYQQYLDTYGSLKFEPGDGFGTLGASKIKFFGFDLTPMTFCWQFGTGSLQSEESFAQLKGALARIPIVFMSAGLETIDYGALSERNGPRTFLLVSNVESPLFTQHDTILKRVQSTTKCPVTYMSWTRRLEIDPASDASTDLQNKMKALTRRHSIHHIGVPLPFSSEKEVLECVDWHASSLEELIERKPYNSDSLIISLLFESSNSSKGSLESRLFLKRAISVAIPLFRRIIIVSESLPEEMVQWCSEQELERSYFISCIEWTTEHSVVAWDLRGAI